MIVLVTMYSVNGIGFVGAFYGFFLVAFDSELCFSSCLLIQGQKLWAPFKMCALK
jgi:hypothetical protein